MNRWPTPAAAPTTTASTRNWSATVAVSVEVSVGVTDGTGVVVGVVGVVGASVGVAEGDALGLVVDEVDTADVGWPPTRMIVGDWFGTDDRGDSVGLPIVGPFGADTVR